MSSEALLDPVWWQFLSVMIYFKYWLLRFWKLSRRLREILFTSFEPACGIKCLCFAGHCGTEERQIKPKAHQSLECQFPPTCTQVTLKGAVAGKDKWHHSHRLGLAWPLSSFDLPPIMWCWNKIEHFLYFVIPFLVKTESRCSSVVFFKFWKCSEGNLVVVNQTTYYYLLFKAS